MTENKDTGLVIWHIVLEFLVLEYHYILWQLCSYMSQC